MVPQARYRSLQGQVLQDFLATVRRLPLQLSINRRAPALDQQVGRHFEVPIARFLLGRSLEVKKCKYRNEIAVVIDTCAAYVILFTRINIYCTIL